MLIHSFFDDPDDVREADLSVFEAEKRDFVGGVHDAGQSAARPDRLPGQIQRLADERAQARKEKNWKRSDELRDALAAAGYVVKDTPQGQSITKA